MTHLDDFTADGPSVMVQQFSQFYHAEVQDLANALHWRQLMNAFDSPYAFHRTRALAAAFRILRGLPAPQASDPFECLSLEGATGRDGSAPSIVSGALKRTFPPMIKGGNPDEAIFLSEQRDSGGLTCDATWFEKELCFRLCQGTCILSASQRRLAEESRIVDVVLGEMERLRKLVKSKFLEEPPAGLPRAPSPKQSAGQPTRKQAQHSSETFGSRYAADYRVSLAGVDALEAATHYSPATLYRILKHGGVLIFVALLSDSRHPRILRAAVADFIATLIVETSNALDWPDVTTSVALESDLRNALRLVQQRQQSDERASTGTTRAFSSAAQFFDALRNLRDYEGVSLFREVPFSSNSASPNMVQSPKGATVTTMMEETMNGTLRRIGALRKDTGALMARKRKAREERFNTLLNSIALPWGESL